VEAIFELVIMFLAFAAYGTPERPRHPAIRNSLRLFAFGGSAILLALMLGVLGELIIPDVAIFLWAISGLIVLLAENDLGRPSLAFAAIGTVACLSGVAIWQYV
jgi:hypothetical protein